MVKQIGTYLTVDGVDVELTGGPKGQFSWSRFGGPAGAWDAAKQSALWPSLE